MNTDTPETDAMVSADQHHLEDDNFFSASVYWRMCDLARRIERERDELQKAVNGLCNHLQVSPANTTLLAVEILKIERERDEAREYADKLAEGLPDGMLPKDVDVLREANLGLATNIAAVTKQRDEARDERDKMQTELDMWRDGYIMHEVHRNELEKVEQQRNSLAEALRFATAYPLSESWYKQAIEALATTKPCD
jgi:hypothetical protein